MYLENHILKTISRITSKWWKKTETDMIVSKSKKKSKGSNDSRHPRRYGENRNETKNNSKNHCCCVEQKSRRIKFLSISEPKTAACKDHGCNAMHRSKYPAPAGESNWSS